MVKLLLMYKTELILNFVYMWLLTFIWLPELAFVFLWFNIQYEPQEIGIV